MNAWAGRYGRRGSQKHFVLEIVRKAAPNPVGTVSHLVETEQKPEVSAWVDIEAVLGDVLADIDVRMINGTAKDSLDYAEQGTKGLKVIAVGGNKLARGLTLEGLCTSYFVRTTKMYDTLMQMGRWFGYRTNYIDLCRLYTTEELVEWFGHIADASEELRQEFDAMAESGATPKEYGSRRPVGIPSMMLFGPPGVGKTHFCEAFASVLHVPVRRHPMDQAETSSALLGSEITWSNIRYGLVFELLAMGDYANPVVILDELDKASGGQGSSGGLASRCWACSVLLQSALLKQRQGIELRLIISA